MVTEKDLFEGLEFRYYHVDYILENHEDTGFYYITKKVGSSNLIRYRYSSKEVLSYLNEKNTKIYNLKPKSYPIW